MYHAQEDHWLAKIGGFLLLPALGTVGTALVATAAEGAAPKTNPGLVAAVAGTAVFGAVAYGLYQASESDSLSEGMQAFFRGGMWGAGIDALFLAGSAVISPPGPAISGPNPQLDKLINLMTAQAAGKVALKRAKARAALPAPSALPAR
jgi:hypothetical protein